jgi:hypothetical protein
LPRAETTSPKPARARLPQCRNIRCVQGWSADSETTRRLSHRQGQNAETTPHNGAAW